MKPLAQNTLIQNRYLIVQLIGKGGMGEVYLAVDQRLGSAIALKRCFFAGDENLGGAFEREARVLARLRHPVLPKVSDHFGEGDEQFLVMEHISGDDLSKRIEANGKPFPLSWVMFWADQLLDALSYLHSHEPPIIHRDIKPQNLKLTDENHIVLLDFGLSKTSTGLTNLSSGTGSTGSVVGYTPHYAPMEQIRGIGTSSRSDLYSLSATLYQLMTNMIPADALTRADGLLNGSPDPIKAPTLLNPEVPPAVSEVILHGMEVSQEKRFSNAREMQKALRKAFSEMQNAMAAQTVAFNASDLQANGEPAGAQQNFDATEVMDPEALRAISNPIGAAVGSSGFSESISQPQAPPPVDLNATIAYDSGLTGDSIKQSDVKTEVFNVGSTGGAFPPVPSEAQRFEPSMPQADPGENFAPTTDYSSLSNDAAVGYNDQSSPAEVYSPEHTVPYVALDHGAIGNGEQDSSPSPLVADSHPVQEQNSYAAAADAAPPALSAQPKTKGSTGKIVAILGGLFIFFVAVLAVGGGGYYYYTNYYAAEQADPSPSPEPTVEPTPLPSPTVEAPVLTDNTNSSDSNTNSGSTDTNSLSVAPTPEPTPTERPAQVDRPDTRPTPAGTRPPPATPRPKATQTPRPQPTKKPGGTGPVILQ
ncbi:MAG: protein kinase [bacterium]|nr:protein kinase [bacterium]